MADKPSLPAGTPLFPVFGLPAYPSESKIADKRPRISRAATVEDADDESVDDEYGKHDGNKKATEQLCSRCSELGLTIEHFIINRVPGVTPQHFGRYSVNLGATNPNFSLRTGRSPEVFATLDELKSKRESCGFCDLVWRAMTEYGRNLAKKTECSLTWQVDGRAGPEDPGYGYGRFRKAINKTRRLKLSWGENENEGQVYLVLAVAGSTSDATMGMIPKQWQETHSLGREFSDHTEKQALMRDWLDSCVHVHGETCSATHGTSRDFLRLIDETYFGVIDVLDMQLKSLPTVQQPDGTRSPEKYVALSYVWGKGSKRSRYVTTAATVSTHIKRGGLATAWAKLPRTIQDAILLVNRLGQRYLWVDSLCITQGNEMAWDNNAKAMHLIYGHAYFTICSADGDAESGLAAAATMLRGTQSFRSADTNGKTHGDKESDGTTPMSTQYAPGIRILVTRPLEVVIHDSDWSKRAWTFQEQILSRRCLIFAEGRVYFQCRLAGISEDIWTDSNGNGWSLNRPTSPLQSPSLLKRRPIWFYMNFTRLYTSRCLTMAKDILSAFQGINRLLEDSMDREPFLFGLPTSHFDLALLWTPTRALRRRKKAKSHRSGDSHCSQDENGNCACNIGDVYLDGVKFQFPSWSWCGWMGDEGMGSQVIYDEALLEGCISNVSKWLEDRTWIIWFLRDDKGHLRPLRDHVIRKSRPDIHEEDRWKGYTGSQAWEPTIEDTNSKTVTREETISSSGPLVSTRDRNVRFTDGEDSSKKPRPQRYESLEKGEGSRLIKYRVGSGGYFRPGSLLEPEPGDSHEESRSSSRLLQSMSEDVVLRGDVGAIIPENPFGTIQSREPFVGKAVTEADAFSQATLPQYLPLLQFGTLLKKLYVSAREPSHPPSSNGLCVCDVADDYGDWCGSVTVPRTWIKHNQNKRLDFIAISEARNFTMDECPVWTYYVPKERGESQWDLFYVLLLERDEEHCWWERVALGKVFKAAFETAEWAEIQLS